MSAQSTPGMMWVLFSFRGRLGRRSFFLGSLLPVIGFAIGLFGLLGEVDYASSFSVDTTTGINFVLLMMAALLISPWVYAALAVKRLKDLNLAWPLVFVVLVPFVALPAYIALCLIDGTDGSNPYGPRRNSRPWDK
jgi:uncharacterized membrane protein YhaH (DUF805 family)